MPAYITPGPLLLRTGTRSACARIRPSVSGSSGSAKGFTTPRSHTPVTRAADKAFPWPRHPAIRRLGCPSAGQTRLLESWSPARPRLFRPFLLPSNYSVPSPPSSSPSPASTRLDSSRRRLCLRFCKAPPASPQALLHPTPPPNRANAIRALVAFTYWNPATRDLQKAPDTGAGAGATAANCNPPATAASPRRSAPARPSQGSGPLKGEQSALEACPRRYEVALVLRPVQARRCGHVFHVFHVFLLALASELAFTHTLLE